MALQQSQQSQQKQQQQPQGGAEEDAVHSCEICGVCGLTDDEIRTHTRQLHVDGQGQCPFCGLTDVSESELIVHVNQAHLDYLTPENECMSFIDDKTPSIEDADSDSLSGDQSKVGANGGGMALHNGHSGTTVENGFCNPLLDQSITRNGSKSHNLKKQATGNEESERDSRAMNTSLARANSESHTGATPKRMHTSNRSSSQDPQMGSSGGGGSSAGGHGSPMRSQLGLKLKTTAINHKTPVKSPLECPLCSFKSDTPNVLEEHINRTHFDPTSPSVASAQNVNHNNVNNHNNNNNNNNNLMPNLNGLGTASASAASSVQGNATLGALQCPICERIFPTISDLELHVNIEHKDILSPANFSPSALNGLEGAGKAPGSAEKCSPSACPMCDLSFDGLKLQEMEEHIETHFGRSPQSKKTNETLAMELDKEAKKLREEQEFAMLRSQYGMDNQGNFRDQSSAAMQRAVYSGQLSVADYYERQVTMRAAESNGIDDGTSCTKSVIPRIVQFSAQTPGVLKSFVCSFVDHYASNYGDKGWGCGYRNMQMLLSSLLQNTTYNEALYSAWGNHGPSRTAMPSISRLQLMVEAAWNQGFDLQGAEQLGCKLHNTRKWIGATEIVTVLSWLRINCQLVDFHKPTSAGGHPELFNYVLQYFEEQRPFTPPLYLQHQGHSRTIIGIEQKANGLTLLILDPSHGPRQVAALGSSLESLRLIRRGPAAMRAPQYQIVAVKGLLESKEQYQASKVLRSLRIPPDR